MTVIPKGPPKFAVTDATQRPAAPVAAPLKKERVSPVAPSRQGLVPFSFFVPPEARRQLKAWAAVHDRSTQEIGLEMMDDWCAKHGLHRLASAKGNVQ